MKEILAVIALVLSLAAHIPYIVEIVQGKVRPERISWLLWTLLFATYFTSSVFADGAILYTAGEFIGTAIILVLALKYGVGGKSRFDLVSLCVALIAFILLILSKDVLVSLVLALIVDGIGAILTIRKLHLDPSSESKSFWGIAAIASVLAICSLTVYDANTLLFPLYAFFLSIYIFLKAKPATRPRHSIEKL